MSPYRTQRNGLGHGERVISQKGFARFWLLVLLALILLGGALWLYLGSADRSPIRIGLAVNLTGHGGTAGEYVREGMMLAVEQVNREGGINGRMLELIVKDDMNTPEGIRAADQALIDAGVMIIVGHVTSRNTLIAYPEVTSRGVLLFTPYSATNRLSGKDDLFIRTSVDTKQYGGGMARLLNEVDASTTALLMDMSNRSFVTEYFDEIHGHRPAGYAKVELHSRTDLDWDSLIRQLLSRQPDAIVFLTEVSMTGIAAQKLRAAGYRGPMFATLWAQSPDLMRFGGAAVEGMSLVTFIDPDNQRPEYQVFREQVLRRLGREPNARSTRAYEAIQILAEAMRKSPELTVGELREQLLRGSFNTLMGKVEFDAYGDVARPIYEIKVSQGRFTRARELP